jgi:hypothetical protein
LALPASALHAVAKLPETVERLTGLEIWITTERLKKSASAGFFYGPEPDREQISNLFPTLHRRATKLAMRILASANRCCLFPLIDQI